MEIGDEYGDFIVTGPSVRKIYGSASGTKRAYYYPLLCKSEGCGRTKFVEQSIVRLGNSKTCKCNPAYMKRSAAAIQRVIEKKEKAESKLGCAITKNIDAWFADLQKSVEETNRRKELRKMGLIGR